VAAGDALQEVWSRGQQGVGGAVHRVSQRLPFPLPGVDSGNGGKSINRYLYDYCQRHGITFTRSRPCRKNDSRHVEQRNWTVVRRPVGYDRYSSRAALEQLGRVYQNVRLYTSSFQPAIKLKHKTRVGARVHKVYHEVRTPYRRLRGDHLPLGNTFHRGNTGWPPMGSRCPLPRSSTRNLVLPAM